MDKDVHTKIYEEYISAMRKLADAQAKAKKFFPSIPLYPVEELPDSTFKDSEVLKQLNKAYKEYAVKYKIWRISKKLNAL